MEKIRNNNKNNTVSHGAAPEAAQRTTAPDRRRFLQTAARGIGLAAIGALFAVAAYRKFRSCPLAGATKYRSQNLERLCAGCAQRNTCSQRKEVLESLKTQNAEKAHTASRKAGK